MIVIDTSALIDSLCGSRRSAAQLRSLIANGERIVLTALVLYEWLRGPRSDDELGAQEDLLPAAHALPFGAAEAMIAANLYGKIRSPRGREIDLAIAAVAVARDAALWTLNESDFRDIPGLQLVASGQ